MVPLVKNWRLKTASAGPMKKKNEFHRLLEAAFCSLLLRMNCNSCPLIVGMEFDIADSSTTTSKSEYEWTAQDFADVQKIFTQLEAAACL
jgi:hypothetical protein